MECERGVRKLSGAYRLNKPVGYLLYVTCSRVVRIQSRRFRSLSTAILLLVQSQESSEREGEGQRRSWLLAVSIGANSTCGERHFTLLSSRLPADSAMSCVCKKVKISHIFFFSVHPPLCLDYLEIVLIAILRCSRHCNGECTQVSAE